MPPTQETLFSLELVIDYVRFDGSRGTVLDPAVGIRLLDFPTLLIYHSGREDPLKSGYADLCVSPDAVPQADDGDNLKYTFHKGKSCLFKINLDSLHTHLLNTPLYAMVLDVKDEIPRLIGSSLISLAKVTERIKVDVGKHGINTPAAHGERLSSPICNLMGTTIGVISLAYKIVSLGAHLIPHIPDNRVYQVGVTCGNEEHQQKCENEDEKRNVLSQEISLDGQPTDLVISEAKECGIPAYTQTERAVQCVSWAEDAQEYTTFCHPPLFYCSNETSQQERKSFTGLLAAMESLNMEDPEDVNDEEESFDMREFPDTNRLSKLHSTPKPPCEETDSAPLLDVIRQLPLLNALLVELSQLNVQTPHQQPLSIHPNLAWLYTPEPKQHSENQKNSPQRPGRSRTKGNIIKSVKKTEEKSPKRKLKYGLTNTFRLRLKMVKSSPITQHECIEYQDVKQDRTNKTKISYHKHGRKAVSRGVRLDEDVQTAMSTFKMKPKSEIRTNLKESQDSLIERNQKVLIPSQNSTSSTLNNPGFMNFKDESRPSSYNHPNNTSFEYQDDFTSVNTTDGYTPDIFSSPEPEKGGQKAHSGSSTSSKALPVPARAEKSPQRSLKSTHIIRPRLQTSALSVSSDEVSAGRHGSQMSGPNTPSVCRTFGRSESFESTEKDMRFGRVSEDFAANKAVLKSISSSEKQEDEEELDELGSLGLDGNCYHISELVVNKLPGYTL
ncbi:microtubule-associated protein 10 [Danio aesculapii]|uniref:microtubule-associated protein 10 n=1 Tax=Danio aesculapii TaxID=1142201 RepID=UPI0024BF1729|nr:microtubule-associated protein 10 [Danio aesculapii]